MLGRLYDAQRKRASHIRSSSARGTFPVNIFCAPQAILWAPAAPPILRPIVSSHEDTQFPLNSPVTKLIIQATRHTRSLSNRIAFVRTRVAPPARDLLLPHRRAGHGILPSAEPAGSCGAAAESTGKEEWGWRLR